MMKVKTNTKKETDLWSEWLTRNGVPHTVKGFTLEFSDMDQSAWDTVKSSVRLNTNLEVD